MPHPREFLYQIKSLLIAANISLKYIQDQCWVNLIQYINKVPWIMNILMTIKRKWTQCDFSCQCQKFGINPVHESMPEKVCHMIKYLRQKASRQSGSEMHKTSIHGSCIKHTSAFYISRLSPILGMHLRHRWTLFKCISWQGKYWMTQIKYCRGGILDQIQKMKGLEYNLQNLLSSRQN